MWSCLKSTFYGGVCPVRCYPPLRETLRDEVMKKKCTVGVCEKLLQLSSQGGIQAVVYTDTFQAIVMIFALIIVVAMGFVEVGGFTNVWQLVKDGMRAQFNV